MLSNEKKFFLQCLSDFCNQRTTDIPSYDVDLKKIYQYGQEHSTGAILYWQCGEKMNMISNLTGYQNALANEMYYSVNRTQFMKEVIYYFEQIKRPFICMKGSVFRNHYPVPELRSMGDIDIIIRQEDKEGVDQIFINHMKFTRYIDNHSVWTYYLKDFQFEVHNHMFYENLANDFDYIGYFDQIFEHKHHDRVFGLNSEYMYVPDDNYHFLYLMTHTAKHIINNGSGFRAYLDMYMFTKDNEDLDWEWIRNELIKLRLMEFTETCFALCEKWFDVKMPLSHKELDPAFYEEITEKTFNDGVFGLSNKANEGAHTAKEIKREKKGYWITAVRLIFRLIFPPYSDLILIPRYSLVKGRKWLLPFVWIFRWFYCLIYKFSESIRRLSEPFRIKNKIEKREDYINSWGL